MSSGSRKGPQADINVTPLVDIVLVLLIIFMVITPLLTKELKIEVPQKAEVEEPPQDQKEQLVIVAFADGHVELNKTTSTPDELKTLLEERLAARVSNERIVFFEAEDDVPYGAAVALMDLAKGSGATTIGMITPDKEEPADGAAPPTDGAVPAAPTGGI
jgi:biopolymer transport protein ExbD/biopolymer transport protein TolR